MTRNYPVMKLLASLLILCALHFQLNTHTHTRTHSRRISYKHRVAQINQQGILKKKIKLIGAHVSWGKTRPWQTLACLPAVMSTSCHFCSHETFLLPVQRNPTFVCLMQAQSTSARFAWLEMSSQSVCSFAQKGRNISNFSFDASVLEFVSTNPAYIFLKHILLRGQNILNHKVRPFLENQNPPLHKSSRATQQCNALHLEEKTGILKLKRKSSKTASSFP